MARLGSKVAAHLRLDAADGLAWTMVPATSFSAYGGRGMGGWDTPHHTRDTPLHSRQVAFAQLSTFVINHVHYMCEYSPGPEDSHAMQEGGHRTGDRMEGMGHVMGFMVVGGDGPCDGVHGCGRGWAM